MSQQYPYQPAPVQPAPVQPAPAPKKRRGWVPWAAGAGLFFLGLIIGTSSDGGTTPAASSPGATTTVTVPAEPGQTVSVPGPTKTVPGPVRTITAPPPAPKAAITEDGTWLVGTEVKPGTYRSGPDGDCYYARLSSTDGGGVDNIIDNGNGGNQTVTIKKSDKAFETRRCGTWTKVG